MPWTLILYGVLLPLSLAGLLLAVFANFKIQSLAAPTIALPERVKQDAIDAIEALPEWRKYRRLIWAGVGLVVVPTGAMIIAITLDIASSPHHPVATLSPGAFLPLMLSALPLVLSNTRRRQRLMAKAGLRATATTFSVKDVRKLEALKQTPEWRRLSRDAWMASGLILLGACGLLALVFAKIGELTN